MFLYLRYFIILISDRGYDRIIRGTTKIYFREFCPDVGAVFLCPRKAGEILQLNENLRAVLVDSSKITARYTKCLNHNQVVTKLRRAVENLFGALKQHRILQHIPSKYWNLIGETYCKDFGVPKGFSKIQRIVIIVGVVIASFNRQHKKFHLNYVGDEAQIFLARHIMLNLGLFNPFIEKDLVTWKYNAYPNAYRVPQLVEFAIGDIDKYRSHFSIPIPTLLAEDYDDLFSLSKGPFINAHALNAITAVRRRYNVICIHSNF